MDAVKVQNFRCFGEEQTVPLAPLTLLIGDNSTGKTSFLALIRAIWDVAYGNTVPNFRERPYDLGSFSEVIRNSSRRVAQPESFEAGFRRTAKGKPNSEDADVLNRSVAFTTVFENFIGSPYPVRRRFEDGTAWIDYSRRPGDARGNLNYGVAEIKDAIEVDHRSSGLERQLFPLYIAGHHIAMHDDEETPDVNGEFIQSINDLTENELMYGHMTGRPYATAPIRSRPSRTYDPIAMNRDAEGEYIPTYLARTSMFGADVWKELRARLVDFGRDSGLFDDIRVQLLGKTQGSPFQILARKQGKRLKGQYRNIVDMGYGVSQVLPILTETLRTDGPNMFLLQQPEVHLHPSAQAALGTLFCSSAATGKQLIVETHSDHLIDRVRMDVRDRATKLKPEEVSILFFERIDPDVKIHSISIDELGNLGGSPPGYRQFFMDEVNRSIGLVSLEALHRA